MFINVKQIIHTWNPDTIRILDSGISISAPDAQIRIINKSDAQYSDYSGYGPYGFYVNRGSVQPIEQSIENHYYNFGTSKPFLSSCSKSSQIAMRPSFGIGEEVDAGKHITLN